MHIINEPHVDLSRNYYSWLRSVDKSDLSPDGVLFLPKEVYGIEEYALDRVNISKIVIPEGSWLTLTTHLDKVIGQIKQIKVGDSEYRVVRDYESFYSSSYFMVNTKEEIASLKSPTNTVVYNGYKIEFLGGKIAGDKFYIAHDKKQNKWLYANDLESLEFKANYAQSDKKLGPYLSQGKVDRAEVYNMIRLAIKFKGIFGFHKNPEDVIYEKFKEIVGDNETFNAKEILCILKGQSGLRDDLDEKSYNDCVNCGIVAKQRVCNARTHCRSFGMFR
jgi:hypothetical protein